MEIRFNPGEIFQFHEIVVLVKKEFEEKLFVGEMGFRFLEDVSVGNYYEVNVFSSGDQLNASVCKWNKLEGWRIWADPLERFKLKGCFMPELIKEKIILSKEENEYFKGFMKELLEIPEEKIFEPTNRLLLDGCDYVLQLFEKGEMKRIFKWDDVVKTEGLMNQLMKLSSGIRKKSKLE